MPERTGLLAALYKPSLALLTDLYQLTMAYGYWKLGRADEQAVFHLTYRKQPFGSGYGVAAGLESAIEYLRGFRFDREDLDYLATIPGNDGKPIFDRGFLDHLAKLELSLDVDAIPEGTAVFPHEPLLRVRGSILQAQLLETPLLNLINFQTLIATKSARICAAAQGEPVLEFGLRRAQGVDGALTASRAAYVGGAAATSNVLAGRLLGIPVKGTHAHSWVMSFDDELESFEAYAEVMPNNCIFLVDTYDTLEGVRRAAEVGRRLRERGHKLAGIRLDSGDLTYLSIEARKILDAAGLRDATIVASNDLDEHTIEDIKRQGATVAVWGVGTRLVTAHDQPALGGVYKLSAIRPPGENWLYRVKLSEQAAKTSTPGVLQVRRYRAPAAEASGGGFIGDMIYDELMGPPEPAVIVDPGDVTRRKHIDAGTSHEELLAPIFRGGKLVYDVPSLKAVRAHTAEQLASLHPTIRRLLNPHAYPAGLALNLSDLKTKLILEAHGDGGSI